MKRLFIFILLFIPFTSNASSCDLLKEIDWIFGSWKSTNQDSTITENWHQVSDETFEGVGKTYVKGKLKSSESLRIVEMSAAFFYIAKVDHNLLPVAFKLIKCTDENIVFENLTHDFPKRIEYKHTEKNKMLVVVSDGKNQKISINFIRSNTN
jgi:hypothetical protein